MSDEIIDVDNEKMLDQLEQQCLERINTANALTFTTGTEGWQILLDTFEDMKQNQLEELSNQTPGNDKAILAAHAVWYSVVHTLDQIVDSATSVIQDGVAAKQTLAEIRSQQIDHSEE
jgi:hypothetical protein